MNKGFTMVELLAVIIILSGIMLIAIPSYNDIAFSVKESSLKTKTNAINSAMLKFAKLHLIDQIKPADEDCTVDSKCCQKYDLDKFILEYGIYPAEEKKDDEGIIINPLTNGKLNGCVRIWYETDTFNLKAEFLKDEIISTKSADC